MAAGLVRLNSIRPCPICGKPSTQAVHPFCSLRCKDIDLNRWLSGRYVIPTEEAPSDAIPEDAADEAED